MREKLLKVFDRPHIRERRIPVLDAQDGMASDLLSLPEWFGGHPGQYDPPATDTVDSERAKEGVQHAIGRIECQARRRRHPDLTVRPRRLFFGARG